MRLHCTARRLSSLAAILLAASFAGCAARHPPPAPNASLCLARLDEAGVRFTPASPPADSAACAVEAPVLVSAAAVGWNRPGIVSCGFALALADFAREDVAPSALARFGTPLRAIRHFGTYACRRENGGTGRWSQHASGKAIDIAGFELADGRVILVARDWRGHGPKSAFLHEVARRACRRFSVVLTPASDAEHNNHIHLDNGPYKHCGV
jgi:hypothetical protein